MRRNTLAVIVILVVLAYAIICFLAIPALNAATCAVVFAVIQAALLLFAATSRATEGSQGLYLTYPRLVVPTCCCIAQLIAGALLAALMPDALVVAVAVGVVLAVVSLVSVLAVPKATDYAQDVEQRVADKTYFVKDLRKHLAYLRLDMPAGEVADALEELIEKARCSDPVSNAASAPFEEQISRNLEGKASLDMQEIVSLSKLIDKRNQACKAGK